MDAKELLSRYSKLKTRRSGFESKWQEVADYLLAVPYDLATRQLKQRKPIMDTTATSASRNLAHSIKSTLASGDWWSGTINDSYMAQDPIAKDWLETAVRTTNHYLNQSNLDQSLLEVITDTILYGTGGLLIEEDDEEYFSFSARNPSELVISENHKGLVDTVFREEVMSARNCIEKWGNKCTKLIQDTYKADQDANIKILHAILPRTNRNKNKIDAKNKPFASVWIDVNSGEIISESGFDTLPLPVCRWSKYSGQIYGHGPAMEALSEIKRINEELYISVTAKALNSKPPLLLDDDGILSRPKMIPGEVLYRRPSRNGSKGFEFLTPANTNPSMIDSEISDCRESISKSFYNDIIMSQQLQYVTAEGIKSSSNERERVLSSVVGRIQNELLEPLIQRVFNILLNKNVFPPIPEPLKKQKSWRIVWNSPLARRQEERRADALSKAFALIGTAQQFLGPAAAEIVQRFDMDSISAEIGAAYSLPGRLLKTDQMIKREREAAQQAAQQQQQQEMMLRAGTQIASMESQTQSSNGPVGSFLKSLGSSRFI
jgi:hypothetical protein